MLVDRGKRPRNGTPSSAAAASAPPLPNGCDCLAAMRAGVARHILDDAEHRHAGLAEQVDRPPRVDQRQVLRRRDDHRARRPRPSGSATAARRRFPAAGRRGSARCRPSRPRSAWPGAGRHRPAPRQRVPGETSWPSDRKRMPCASTGISLSFFGRRLLDGARAGSAATGRKCRRRSGRPCCPFARARPPDSPPRSTCRRRPCRCRSRSKSGAARAAVIATLASLTPGMARAAARRSLLQRFGAPS